MSRDSPEFHSSTNLISFAAPMVANATGIASASLKGKLLQLEELIRQITEEMNYYKREALSIKTEKETLENVLGAKIQDSEKNLANELIRVEEEMKRHFSHQKAENSRLQQQLTQLKADKEDLRRQIEMLSERVDQLEVSVGDDEP